MSDVFISYSRKNSVFMERIHDALRDAGYTAWVDWEAIPKGIEWLNEIYSGIEGAHTFVIIISPDAMTSEICHKEIAHARLHNKRILPVIYQSVDPKQLAGEWFKKNWETTARDNWKAIEDINWLFFQNTDEFDASFKTLLDTLKTDIDHVKFHTRLTVRAKEWTNNQKKSEFLLRGNNLTQAEGWLEISQNKLPSPTTLHQAYISASIAQREQERILRRRIIAGIVIGSLTAVLVMLVLSVVAITQRNTAQRSNNDLGTQVTVANTAVAEASYAINTLGNNMLGAPDAGEVYDCSVVPLAVETYEDALNFLSEDPIYDFIYLKMHYNIGLAYSDGEIMCGEDYKMAAYENIEQAIAMFERNRNRQEVHEAGALAYFAHGNLAIADEQYQLAVDDYSVALSIIENHSTPTQWKLTPWDVLAGRAFAAYWLANTSGTTQYQSALADYDTIISGFESQQFNDPVIASEAYYNRGMIYKILDQPEQAAMDFEAVLSLTDPGDWEYEQSQDQLAQLDT